MLLSPLATAYQPAACYASPTGVVFNDGVPSSMLSDHDIVYGYSGEALDENFPPTAQDAAELEAVEFFVDIMATLDMLEDMEEKARSSFCHIKKRWEARREDGLVSKPRPAKHSVQPVDHTSSSSHHAVGKSLMTTDVVPFDQSNRVLAVALLHSRTRAREDFRRANNSNNKGNAKLNHGLRKPLQQPRKQN